MVVLFQPEGCQSACSIIQAQTASVSPPPPLLGFPEPPVAMVLNRDQLRVQWAEPHPAAGALQTYAIFAVLWKSDDHPRWKLASMVSISHQMNPRSIKLAVHLFRDPKNNVICIK